MNTAPDPADRRNSFRLGFIIVVVLVFATAGAAWVLLRAEPSPTGFDRSQNTLPPEIKDILEKGETFILLSLDPTEPDLREPSAPAPKETFHKYAVLGKTEIHDPKVRADLLRALQKGIHDSDGAIAACFNPRHGISATTRGTNHVDLVICFECAQIYSYGLVERSFLTTKSPRTTFNDALQKAGLPVAKK
jgi:hypothetical protein